MRPEAAGENRLRAQFWLLLALVTVDVVSKLMALRLLSSKPVDDSGAAIQWELAVNPVGLGGAGRRLVGDQGANLVLVGASEFLCVRRVKTSRCRDGVRQASGHLTSWAS